MYKSRDKSRTVHVKEEGPCEQRNQLFTVLGSLTDPEEEESKDSSEVNSMRRAGAGGRVIGVSARGGGATGLITGATFGAGGGETVGLTAGGGVIGDAGGGVAETGGTTVVGNGWSNCY
ncbi:hypothetical protein Bca4012_088302 [Brassica carinata]|uniref:Uncharacterized protein n=1 Tax=Brassica carinata TaxID=52824 RepID=A0A8X7PBV8_BRACI|nr:hypothetical protein Bca52824_088068 [Brassica carinata]